MQKLAAEELQYFIQKITGASLAIHSTVTEDENVKIYVGKSQYTDAMNYSDKGLEYDAYRMISGDNYLVLLGNDDDASFTGPGDDMYKRNPNSAKEAVEEWDKLVGHSRWKCPAIARYKGYCKELKVRYGDHRGSLMAVYDFLRSLGARWYFSGEFGEVLPETQSIALPQVEKEIHPDFPLRRFTGAAYKFGKTNKRHALWIMRLGLGGAKVSGVHGINYVIHRDQTRKEHPDWYVLRNGKRDTVSGGGKPCLSSKGLLEDNIDFVRTYFDVYDRRSVSVMPTDGFVMCECELCKGKYSPELGPRGVQSNLVWDYVNNVAKEVYKTHPDRRIVCASYGSYSVPPTNIDHFSPNVYVMMNNGRLAFVDPEIREIAVNRRKEFLKKVSSKRPFSTHDNYSVGASAVPIYRPHTIAEDVRSLKGICFGEYIEENSLRPHEVRYGQPEPVKLAVNHLNIYVTARFWWDADQDIDALLNEYYRKYYGPAEKEMKAFFEYCEANTRTLGKSKEQIEKMLELIGIAEKKAGEKSIYGRRIALVVKSLEASRNLLRQLSIDRSDVPIFRPQRIDRNDSKITIDGNLDEPYWKRFRSFEQLEDSVAKGKKPKTQTLFKSLMSHSNLYIAVVCEQEASEKTERTIQKKDDPSIWDGEYVDILIETDAYAYYRISVSPDGNIVDLKVNGEDQDFRWDSQAEYAIQRAENKWTFEIKIPFINNNDDPNHKLDGRYPSDSMPWFVNVGRQRIVDGKRVLCSLSYTGKDTFQVIERFARCFMGKSRAEREAKRKAKPVAGKK